MEYRFEEIAEEIDQIRERVNNLRHQLAGYFVEKSDLIDLMVLCTVAQEPLLLVGRPGTAKSDLVIKFCAALSLEEGEYFEYMLTQFTEPSEIVGPIDINELKTGRYLRRVEGKMPQAKVVFLDEIFKSNSAILNTLLTIINERKFYQDGKPTPVRMQMLFGATNEIPEFAELAALRDRFVLKAESLPVRDRFFDQLIEAGMRGEAFRAFNQRPWEGLASLQDFAKLKAYLDHVFAREGDDTEQAEVDAASYFPEEVYTLFKRIVMTLEKEDRLEITDRRVVKLYKLIRTRAFVFHGGVVTREDLTLLRYVADRLSEFEPIRQKVDSLIRLGD